VLRLESNAKRLSGQLRRFVFTLAAASQNVKELDHYPACKSLPETRL